LKQAVRFCLGLFLTALMIFPALSQDQSPPTTETAKKERLAAGIPLIYLQDTSSNITVLQFSIAGGQFAEPLDKSGLAYLATRLTLVLPDRSKTQTIMDMATQLLMTSYPDYTMVSMACLSQNLEESLKVLSEIMQDPLISGIRISNNKEQMERQIKSMQDDSENIIHQTAVALLFPQSRYARSIYGTEDSLKKIKKKALKEFFKQYFRPSNMTAVVCSDLNKTAIVNLLNEYFTEFPDGDAPLRPEFVLPEIDKQSETIERDTQQTLIGLAYRLPPLNARNYACAAMLENLLGKGIGSRLWALREDKKLAYHVNARLNYFREGGVIEAYLETETGKKETAQTELKKIMEQIYASGIPEEEWASVQNYARAAFLRDNETKMQKVQTISFFEMTDLNYTFFYSLLEEMKNISRDEFNAFLKKVLLPDRAVSIIIGPEVSN
jgi:predicted Zn-dependent peptidase